MLYKTRYEILFSLTHNSLDVVRDNIYYYNNLINSVVGFDNYTIKLLKF